MAADRLVFRVHALQRMYERNISTQDVRTVLETGQIIGTYTEDRPYASRPVLAWVGSRPLHVVAATNVDTAETIVITVYEPEAQEWGPDFRSKRR